MYKKNANWLLLVVLIAVVLTTIATSLGKYTETVSTAITLNITKPTYTVRFHPNNGGPDNYTTQSFTYGTSQALDANTFTNGSLAMLEWTTNSDGTGDSYEDEEVITTGLTQVNGAIVDLYAKWGSSDYWVTFVYGDESFTGPTGQKYINSDLALFSQANIDRDFEVSLSVSNFVHTSQDRDLIISHQCELGDPFQGFSFGYRDGAIKVQLKSSRTTQNTYSWGKTSGAITFAKQGAGANRKIYVDGVEKISLSDFAGTFEEPLIFGANISDSGIPRRFLQADLSDMRIKLKYTYSEMQQLFGNLPNPTRTAYSFGGWYTAPVGGTRVTSSTPITSTNIVLYARWESAGTVTFNANGGTGTMSGQSFSPGHDQALTINGFSRTGYSFVGWNTSADGTGTSYTDMQVTNFGSDITLYAQWEAFHTGTDYFYANGSVRFNKNNGDIINTGINLFSQTNYNRNFEAYFEIIEVGSNNNQACLINSKNETASPWPGFVVRTNSNKLQLKADRAASTNDPTNTYSNNNLSSTTTHSIRIIRINGVTYYSINNGTFQTLLDFTGFESTAASDTPVAFGGFIKPNGDLGRPFNGVLANMYVGFVDSSITLSDYEGGYTAPRTGGASLSSSMPLNANSALNSRTLQEKMESDILFIDALLSATSKIDEEETEEIIEKENTEKDEEISELDEADEIEVFDEEEATLPEKTETIVEERETQNTENNEPKTQDTTKITAEDDKTNTTSQTEASSLVEDETATVETEESKSQNKEENTQAEEKEEETPKKDESTQAGEKEEETPKKEESTQVEEKEEETSKKEESTTAEEKEGEAQEKEEPTTAEEKQEETQEKDGPTTVEEKEEASKKDEATTTETKEIETSEEEKTKSDEDEKTD